jgi:transcriptional regulator with XRE-family HTH domain
MELHRFPNKLKWYRKSKGYTQLEVSEMLDLSTSGNTLRWEKGMVLPGLIPLCQLSVLYNVEVSKLYPEVFEVVTKDIGEKLKALEKEKFIARLQDDIYLE